MTHLSKTRGVYLWVCTATGLQGSDVYTYTLELLAYSKHEAVGLCYEQFKARHGFAPGSVEAWESNQRMSGLSLLSTRITGIDIPLDDTQVRAAVGWVDNEDTIVAYAILRAEDLDAVKAGIKPIPLENTAQAAYDFIRQVYRAKKPE